MKKSCNAFKNAMDNQLYESIAYMFACKVVNGEIENNDLIRLNRYLNFLKEHKKSANSNPIERLGFEINKALDSKHFVKKSRGKL